MEKGKTAKWKERQRVVEVKEGRESFCSLMISTFKEFQCHIKATVQQCEENQRESAHRSSLDTLEDIQSPYWNNAMITLHPSVIYYKDTDDNLCHTSYVHVSEVLCHNAAMVMTIIDKLVKTVKEIKTELTCVHFWTDSPSSKYRNKSIFDLVSRFP